MTSGVSKLFKDISYTLDPEDDKEEEKDGSKDESDDEEMNEIVRENVIIENRTRRAAAIA